MEEINMTNNQATKELNFTGVNHESNKKLINELEFSIALITPKEGYHINIPNELVNSVAKIKQRLNLYQDFMDAKREPKEEINPLIAFIINKDASVHVIDIESSGNVSTEDIIKEIKDAIFEEETLIKIGTSTINVNNVWQVEDGVTRERFTINEDNNPHLTPISKETIPVMQYTELKETIDMLTEWNYNSDEIEDKDSLLELLDHAIDELDQRYCNEAYEHERVDRLLCDFINHFNLHDKFHQFLYELETQRENNDPYNVINEVYGDIDNFMKNHFLTKGGE
jgi:hypothetical protein